MKVGRLENPSLAYCAELMDLAQTNPNIVLVTADSVDPIGLGEFACTYPERFLDVGIAEQAMTNVAAGLASVGWMPFISAFAMFQTLRAGDNIRNGIAYPRLNVKIIAANIGLNVGKNGATHHALEDIAVIRAIPGMTVVSPADARATRKLVRAVAAVNGPVYMRLDKIPTPVVYQRADESFELGKGKVLATGKDVAILATGSTVITAVQAREVLISHNIDPCVVDLHTIKPLDKELILYWAKTAKTVVTVEPHSTIGGLGSAVSELLGKHCPTPIERVGVDDVFTESGKVEDLNRKYGLDVDAVLQAAERAFKRKGG